MEQRQTHDRNHSKKAKARGRGRIVAAVIAVVLVAAAVGGYLYIDNLRNRTASYFDGSAKATAAPAATDAPIAETDAAAVATPTADPEADEYAALEAQADQSLLSENIVNVLLVGVDYAEERTTEDWLASGGSTAEHADVMIVLAINFDKQTVDMISLPRDTYAKIPGVQGLYKLNASLDCGGGLFLKDETGAWLADEKGNYKVNSAGFDKVCAACSWMLGDIPINYYYAVTMPAVKELVNAIGGVDYNLDVSFSMQGREYTAGQQHMDGQAVLDYLRVRKAASGLGADETGDGHRVGRQKDMLVAILNQLRSKGMLLQVPKILDSFEGQLFTNCTFNQTAALALYAYDMPTENIRMWSMDGIWSSKKSAELNFCFTDQDKRVEIIKEVYGVEKEPHLDCTMAYAYCFWQYLQAERYLATCSGLKKYITNEGKDGGDFLDYYKKVSSGRGSAEGAMEKFLKGETGTGTLTSIAEELEANLECLKDAAISAKAVTGYSKSLDLYSTLKRYNEIEVDPS